MNGSTTATDVNTVNTGEPCLCHRYERGRLYPCSLVRGHDGAHFSTEDRKCWLEPVYERVANPIRSGSVSTSHCPELTEDHFPAPLRGKIERLKFDWTALGYRVLTCAVFVTLFAIPLSVAFLIFAIGWRIANPH